MLWFSSKKEPIETESKVISNLSDGYKELPKYTDGSSNMLKWLSKTEDTPVEKQNDLIRRSRQACNNSTEIENAVSMIVYEMIDTTLTNELFSIVSKSYDIIDDNTLFVLNSGLKTIINRLSLQKNLEVLLRHFIIDGAIALHIIKDPINPQKGILDVEILDLIDFWFDQETKIYRYKNSTQEYLPSEIVFVDSGVYNEENLYLSYIYKAIKLSTQLNTLEDLLVPLRYSRSVARRKFTIDIDRLNEAQALQYVNKIRDEFTYKKYYSTESGGIVQNEPSVVSLVESYFVPKRGDTKGVDIETFDELGNITDQLTDLNYIKQKKLLEALHIPASRASSDAQTVFDYTSATQVQLEEDNFQKYVKGIRNRFSDVILQLLRLQLVKESISETQWDYIKTSFFINWGSELKYEYVKKMQMLNDITQKFGEAEPLIGKYISKAFVYRTLGFSESEIKDMKKEMEDELEASGGVAETPEEF